MVGLVKSRASNLKFWLFNVYGPSRVLEKRTLWNFLVSLATPLQNVFLIFGGDFNTITSMDEKPGGIIPYKQVVSNFCSFIHSLNLVDCKPLNGSFTWTNMRRDFCQILERLNRFLVLDNWFNSGHDFVSSILPFSGSNHFPIQFNIFEDRAPRKLPFKFEPMWFRDQSFLPSLKHWWNSAPFFPRSWMFQLVKKLGFLKLRIKDWNVLHFKNIFGKKARIQEEIEQLNERIVASGMSSAMYDKLKLLNM